MDTRKHLFETKFKTYINEQAEIDVKTKLIDSLTAKLNSMKTNNDFTALAVAQVMYNNCAHFMNKTDIYANRVGDPTSTKAAFAPK